MKIAVLGAGAMGSVYGARLAMAGANVTLLDINQSHLSCINHHGLKVNLDGQVHRVDISTATPDCFSERVDLILLFTKTFHTRTALDSVKAILPGTYILSLQNGIGNADRIQEFVATERILLGMTLTPAEFIEPGSVASHGPANTQFFSADGQHHEILDRIESLFRKADIDAKADPQIHKAIWEKAAFNCAMNAVCALTNATPGAIGESDVGRSLSEQAAREAILVANKLDINASEKHVMQMIAHACAHHLFHEPSMLQDRNAGRPSEIDALNGAVAELGQKLAVDVPVNRTLTALIKLSESAATFRNKHPGE